jgi:hypothetical protein
MNKRDDGGPAFPGAVTRSRQGGVDGVVERWEERVPGMTLRDYFAATEQATYRRAAVGPLGRLWEWLWWGPTVDDEDMARECYEAADAMLAERSR